MTDRPLELGEIQGNVLGGFHTDIQVLLAFTISDPALFTKAGLWVAERADEVTVVGEVRAQREAMKAAPSAPPTWLSLAVGLRFLRSMQVLIRDDAFQGGMLKRAPSILGDKTDPADWKVGGSNAPVDVFLVVASNDEPAAVGRADELVTSARQVGLEVTYRETARRLNDREHFGFRDGISQPLIAGDDIGGNILPGNFIFGYPKEAGESPFSPVIDPRNITDNGSLLVFRRLRQDVSAFRKFCASETAALAGEWPDLTEDHLAALLVGRWRSGAPIKEGQSRDPGADDPDNTFDFSNDLAANSCPIGAHIRKVNPRKGTRDVNDVPRVLRRGIPFGQPFDDAPNDSDRGLAFLAFQSSVKEQFEFLSQHWMNSGQNPGRGNDLLVGRADTVREMDAIGPSGTVTITAPVESWIIPTGGAYLFAPGRSGLKRFAAPAPALGLWKARQLVAMSLDPARTWLKSVGERLAMTPPRSGFRDTAH